MTGGHCKNCGAPLSGAFCGRCGQADADYDVPIREFAGTFLSESLDLDSRLRRTLIPLFFRPGEVAAEFVRGHRARYVPPVRLYIFASFAMFLVLSFTADLAVQTEGGGPSEEIVSAAPGPVEEPSAFEDRLNRGMAQVVENPEEFSSTLLNRTAQAMFLLLPAFALLLKVLHRRRLYVHHLVFAIYFHSVAFLLITGAELLVATGLPGAEIAGGLIGAGIPVHLVVGIRRFYLQRWPVTIAKAAVLAVAYAVVVAATMLGLIALSVLLLGGS